MELGSEYGTSSIRIKSTKEKEKWRGRGGRELHRKTGDGFCL